MRTLLCCFGAAIFVAAQCAPSFASASSVTEGCAADSANASCAVDSSPTPRVGSNVIQRSTILKHGATANVGFEDVVSESESQWISCAYDWNTPSHAHVASAQWHIPDLKIQLSKRRESLALTRAPIIQSDVVHRLLLLLQNAARTLDELNVNWYVAYGSDIGLIRDQSFIPWDYDVDILVKEDERIHVCDFIRQGENAEISEKGNTIAAYRSVPDHPEVLMVGRVVSGHCTKILWIDVETEISVDFCIDCGHAGDFKKFVPTRRTYLGNVEVNVPEDPWARDLLFEKGVDRVHKQISMNTSGEGWSCKTYKCTTAPPPATSAANLTALYRGDPLAMKGPFDFHMEVSSSRANARCSLPRDFAACAAEAPAQTEVWVSPCDGSPWSSHET